MSLSGHKHHEKLYTCHTVNMFFIPGVWQYVRYLPLVTNVTASMLQRAPNQWSNLMFSDKSLFILKSDSWYVVLWRNLACDISHHLYVNCTNAEVEAYSKRLRSKNLRFSTIHIETESPPAFISERSRIKLKLVRVIHWGTVTYTVKFWISQVWW